MSIVLAKFWLSSPSFISDYCEFCLEALSVRLELYLVKNFVQASQNQQENSDKADYNECLLSFLSSHNIAFLSTFCWAVKIFCKMIFLSWWKSTPLSTIFFYCSSETGFITEKIRAGKAHQLQTVYSKSSQITGKVFWVPAPAEAEMQNAASNIPETWMVQVIIMHWHFHQRWVYGKASSGKKKKSGGVKIFTNEAPVWGSHLLLQGSVGVMEMWVRGKWVPTFLGPCTCLCVHHVGLTLGGLLNVSISPPSISIEFHKPLKFSAAFFALPVSAPAFQLWVLRHDCSVEQQKEIGSWCKIFI